MKIQRVIGAAASRLICCATLLVASQATAAGLFVANPGKMTRYELPGYTLVAVDNAQLRRDMAKLPRLRTALEKSLGVEVKPTGIPTYYYVVSSSVWDRYLEPAPAIPGEFVPTRFANYVISNNARINRVQLFHEHTHLYLYNQMPGVYPLWFDEGLALMMAHANYTGSKVEIFPAAKNDEFGWVPTARLLRATKSSPEYLEQKQLLSFHYQSYAMVYRALVDEPEFGKQVFKYLEATNNVATPGEAEAMLGNIDELDSKMRGYLNVSGRKRVMMDVEGVEELKLPAGTPVSTLDSLLGIATICLDAGLHLDKTHELLEAATAEPNGASRVAPLRMRLAARLKNDAELEKLYAVVTKDPDDLAAARAAGLALYERVQTLVDGDSARRTDLSTRSMALLDRSLTARADDPEAVWAFAMQAADLKSNMDVALQRLVPMFGKLPSNPDMALAAGRILYVQGGQDVKPYATAVLRYSHSIEQKRWAAERIQEIRAKAGAEAPASQ
jgi:hypothetical protein